MFFEKFAKSTQKSTVILRSQTLDELAKEVILEVETLLNTRKTYFEGVNERYTGAMGFGLPDFLHLSLHRDDDLKLIEDAMISAINEYEPRLTNVKVVIDTEKSGGGLVNVVVEADLRLGEQLELISFNVFVPNAEPGKRRRQLTV